MARVYLSSTYRDLAAQREAVCKALRKLRHQIVSMEDYSAESRPPLDKCLADVRSCDIYVGIFAWRYGYVPPGESKSITELEFRQAVAAKKTCLIFLLADDAPWPRNQIESVPALDDLRAELQRDFMVGFFKTAEDLCTGVSVAVTNACSDGRVANDGVRLGSDGPRFYRECLSRLTTELRSQERFYLVLSVALPCVGLTVLGVGVAMGQTPVGLGGSLVGTATVYPLTTMLSTRRKKALLEGYQDELEREPPAEEAVSAVKHFLDSQAA